MPYILTRAPRSMCGAFLCHPVPGTYRFIGMQCPAVGGAPMRDAATPPVTGHRTALLQRCHAVRCPVRRSCRPPRSRRRRRTPPEPRHRPARHHGAERLLDRRRQGPVPHARRRALLPARARRSPHAVPARVSRAAVHQRPRRALRAGVALRTYGPPDAVRTDDGVPFATGGIRGLSQLNVRWRRLAVAPQRILAGHPQQNGAHERMHRTLGSEVSAAADDPTHAAAALRRVRRRLRRRAPACGTRRAATDEPLRGVGAAAHGAATPAGVWSTYLGRVLPARLDARDYVIRG